MAKAIEDLTFDVAVKHLHDGNVLSLRSLSWVGNNKQKTYSLNSIQILFKENEFRLLVYDGYGKKIPSRCQVISKNDIPHHINDTKGNQKWVYHKQRVPKKTIDKTIIDEEEAKKLVYEWLLKRHQSESDVVVPEVALGNRRADYLALGKSITIVEIKSQVDTLDRLEEQLKQYLKYANYLYVAIHESKRKSIEKMKIPDEVGVLLVGKRVRMLKRALKQQKDYTVFHGHLGYKDYMDMCTGMKWASKFAKEDIDEIFQNLCKQDRRNYLELFIKNRYKAESIKRKELFYNGEKELSVGSSKGIGVNRMKGEGQYSLSLMSCLGLSKDFLYQSMTKAESTYRKKFKDFKYADLIIEDKIAFGHTIRHIGIPRTYNISLFKKYLDLSKHHHLFELHKLDLEKQFDNYFKNLTHTIVNSKRSTFIDTSSRCYLQTLSSLLGAEHLLVKITKNIKNSVSKLASMCMIDEEMFKECDVILNLDTSKSHIFYRAKEGSRVEVITRIETDQEGKIKL